jgi:hypothetical protein
MAILATEKVLTLDYWKFAGNLQVGDYVINQDGVPSKVTLVQQYHAQTCYRITFDDHLSVAGDAKLTLPTENHKYRARAYQYKGKLKFRRPLRPATVEELVETTTFGLENTKKLSVPTTHPIQLPHQDLPVPPFIFGYWFFNHNANNNLVFTLGRSEELTKRFKDNGYKITLKKLKSNGERYFRVTPSIESQLVPNIPAKIPNNYLMASFEQRLDLLKGILAAKSAQYNKLKDKFRITNQEYRLSVQIQCLVESLGFRSSVVYSKQYNHYIIFFKSRVQLVPNQASPPFKVHYGRRYPKTIDKLVPQLCVYVEIEGDKDNYLVGEGFISCH